MRMTRGISFACAISLAIVISTSPAGAVTYVNISGYEANYLDSLVKPIFKPNTRLQVLTSWDNGGSTTASLAIKLAQDWGYALMLGNAYEGGGLAGKMNTAGTYANSIKLAYLAEPSRYKVQVQVRPCFWFVQSGYVEPND